ncbi:conserved Plasmodium protein, unknown function [Plasmodium relictum]|uniref:PQ-loop repeat-containing protein n=1 Tax=Plasmodium relictum TaxID=85471 RepID=A0A1J1H9E4_PLARL|nr:conserved Plasmodium protein, unknown function [Plasmodium relictum]CRH00222.1 conserved Plasmodium protein, unknown function [Plasmodium relictum]
MKNLNHKVVSEDFYDKQNTISVLNNIFIYSIIVGSCLIKFPQIIKIINNKNVVGISFVTIYLELFIASSLIAFSIKENINIKLFLDVILINTQNIFIVLLMWRYSNKYSKFTKFIKICFYVFLNLYLIFGLPNVLVPFLGLVSAPISCFSKIPQIYLNHKNKNTGNLSLITFFFVFLGNLARIFTIFFSSNNKIYLVNCIFICTLNLTILLQVR